LEQDQSGGDSILDLIYVDQSRVALYLSQLNPDGVMTALVRSAHESGQSSKGVGLKGFAHLDSEKSHQSELTKEIDPRWVLPVALLEELEDRKAIRRVPSSAKLGEFVLFSGSLTLIDLALFRAMWDLQTMRKLIAAGVKSGLTSQQLTGLPKGLSPTELVRDVIALIPHTTQGAIRGEFGSVWFSLRSDGLLLPPGDIALKHGVHVPGEWFVLGVLDARPDETENEGSQQGVQEGLRQTYALVSNLVRKLGGRPPAAFGVTPILLFRSVAQPSVA
jgi:hypothetical protein